MHLGQFRLTLVDNIEKFISTAYINKIIQLIGNRQCIQIAITLSYANISNKRCKLIVKTLLFRHTKLKLKKDTQK